MAKGRDTRRYRELRATFRAECESNQEPCHICGQKIDYTAPANHPDAFNLDHFYPLATHPHLAEDPANFRAAHSACNQSRGTKDAQAALGVPSEQW